MYAGDFSPLEALLLNFVFGAGFTAGASGAGVLSTAAPRFEGSATATAAAAGMAATGAATSEVTLGVAVAPLPPLGWATASGFLSVLVILVELGLALDLWCDGTRDGSDIQGTRRNQSFVRWKYLNYFDLENQANLSQHNST